MINKKLKLVMASIGLATFMMTACAEKSIMANKPIMSTMKNVSIDWDQVRLIWPLDDKITQVEALEYGKAFIKTFNDVVATQDFSLAKSSENSYGGLWDKYKLELEVYNEADIMQPDLYYVNQYMEPGSNDPVIPQIRSDVSTEETTKAE